MAKVALELSESYLKIAVSHPAIARKSGSFWFFAQKTSGLSDEQVSHLVAEILKKQKVNAKYVLVSVPRNQVTVRNLVLPSQNPEEIVQMVDLNIGRIVPYRKDEIAFGHQVLGRDEVGYTRVMVGIAPIAGLRKQSAILEKAGLYIENFVLSSFGSWCRATGLCHSEIKNDTYILLDIDSDCADFMIFNREGLLFSRSISSSVASDASSLEMVKLIGEIKQSLVIFQNEEMSRKPAKIFLTGAPAVLQFEGAISEELGLPVIVVPVVSSEHKDAGGLPASVSFSAVASLLQDSPSKMLTFGIPEIQIRQALKEKTRELTILGTMGVYFLCIFFLLFLSRIYSQSAYLSKLSRGIKELERTTGDLVERERTVEFVKDILQRRSFLPVFISQLYEITPMEIAFTYVNLDKSGTATLRGQSVQLSDVFKFITKLESSPYFKDVSTKYTRTRKLREKEVTDFEVSFITQIVPKRQKK